MPLRLSTSSLQGNDTDEHDEGHVELHDATGGVDDDGSGGDGESGPRLVGRRWWLRKSRCDGVMVRRGRREGDGKKRVVINWWLYRSWSWRPTLSPCQGRLPLLKYMRTYPRLSMSSLLLCSMPRCALMEAYLHTGVRGRHYTLYPVPCIVP